MISFDLKCSSQHVFEAWFKDSRSYENQLKYGDVVCPICNDRNVSKALMTPNISISENKTSRQKEIVMAAEATKFLDELRSHVETNCDYVGNKFAEEARKIHYGEIAVRNIYGEATEKESQELKDEGIDLVQIPWGVHHDA